MTSMRIPSLVVAAMHALFAGFNALDGAFADGGHVWRPLLAVLLLPLGAGRILALVLMRRSRLDYRPRHRGHAAIPNVGETPRSSGREAGKIIEDAMERLSGQTIIHGILKRYKWMRARHSPDYRHSLGGG